MSISSLSDMELVAAFSDVLIESRERLVLELEYIGELDRRKLFFEYPSLWSYLVTEHGLEESTAERKIRAARFLRIHPEVKAMLESGALNLSLLEIAQGCAHREELSDSGLAELLEAISGMSCRNARREVAARYPHSGDLPHDRIRPLTSDVSEVRFAAPNDLLEKLDEIRDLLAHSHPSLTMAELIDVLASEYRKRHHPEEKARRAEERQAKKDFRRASENELVSEAVGKPSATKAVAHSQSTAQSTSESAAQSMAEKRQPSRPLTHQLTLQDGYRCAYIDPVTGKSCESRHGLQRDHIQSWFDGGRTTLNNLRWLCISHHARVTFLRFGETPRLHAPHHQHPIASP